MDAYISTLRTRWPPLMSVRDRPDGPTCSNAGPDEPIQANSCPPTLMGQQDRTFPTASRCFWIILGLGFTQRVGWTSPTSPVCQSWCSMHWPVVAHSAETELSKERQLVVDSVEWFILDKTMRDSGVGSRSQKEHCIYRTCA